MTSKPSRRGKGREERSRERKALTPGGASRGGVERMRARPLLRAEVAEWQKFKV